MLILSFNFQPGYVNLSFNFQLQNGFENSAYGVVLGSYSLYEKAKSSRAFGEIVVLLYKRCLIRLHLDFRLISVMEEVCLYNYL